MTLGRVPDKRARQEVATSCDLVRRKVCFAHTSCAHSGPETVEEKGRMKILKMLNTLKTFLFACMALVLSGVAWGAEDAQFWGPPVGATAPAIEAADQDGTLRDLASLCGERGVLLVLSRSADW